MVLFPDESAILELAARPRSSVRQSRSCGAPARCTARSGSRCWTDGVSCGGCRMPRHLLSGSGGRRGLGDKIGGEMTDMDIPGMWRSMRADPAGTPHAGAHQQTAGEGITIAVTQECQTTLPLAGFTADEVTVTVTSHRPGVAAQVSIGANLNSAGWQLSRAHDNSGAWPVHRRHQVAGPCWFCRFALWLACSRRRSRGHLGGRGATQYCPGL